MKLKYRYPKNQPKQTMFDRKVVIWTGGGIIPGYVLNFSAPKVSF